MSNLNYDEGKTPNADYTDAEKGSLEEVSTIPQLQGNQLQRGLKSRHIQMVSLLRVSILYSS